MPPNSPARRLCCDPHVLRRGSGSNSRVRLRWTSRTRAELLRALSLSLPNPASPTSDHSRFSARVSLALLLRGRRVLPSAGWGNPLVQGVEGVLMSPIVPTTAVHSLSHVHLQECLACCSYLHGRRTRTVILPQEAPRTETRQKNFVSTASGHQS